LGLLQVTVPTNRIAIEFVGDIAHMAEVYELPVTRLPVAMESIGLLFVLHWNPLSEKPEEPG
jgi:hypothetical protein